MASRFAGSADERSLDGNRLDPGHGLKLTLDAKLRAAQGALLYGIDLAIDQDNWNANAGAIVALDPRPERSARWRPTQIPDPEVFVNPDEAEAAATAARPEGRRGRELSGAEPGHVRPLSARLHVQAGRTALAAMQEHILAPYGSIQCTGAVTLFKQRFDNWNHS